MRVRGPRKFREFSPVRVLVSPECGLNAIKFPLKDLRGLSFSPGVYFVLLLIN